MDDHIDADPGEHGGCPGWCRRVHGEQDHPEDRPHQSMAVFVAAVTGRPTLEPDEDARAVSVVVRLVRRLHSELTWVEVLAEESREVRLILTVESARRLVGAVEALLAEASG
jgi:hypothetical protein